MERGPQDMEEDGTEAPTYSRDTEDYCFKRKYRLKGNHNIRNKSKCNPKPQFLELVQLKFFLSG